MSRKLEQKIYHESTKRRKHEIETKLFVFSNFRDFVIKIIFIRMLRSRD